MKIFSLLFVYLLTVASANAQGSTKPFVLGEIRELSSTILHEKRVLNVYLPPGYNPKDTVRYPVIYLLDGSADEDFIHIVGLVYFDTFPWIDRIPRSIVVGIANVDRQRDFLFPTTLPSEKKMAPSSGGTQNFMDFIATDLQPFIDREYKTTNDRTIIGQSAGGLLATEILFSRPYLFNRYIIVSPSLWWDNGSLLRRDPAVLRPDYKVPTAIYIGVGKEGLTPGEGNHVMEVDANVLADKLNQGGRKNLKVYFDYLPEENHATSLLPAAFHAFRMLYPAAK